jgi:hypothetical protein
VEKALELGSQDKPISPRKSASSAGAQTGKIVTNRDRKLNHPAGTYVHFVT